MGECTNSACERITHTFASAMHGMTKLTSSSTIVLSASFNISTSSPSCWYVVVAGSYVCVRVCVCVCVCVAFMLGAQTYVRESETLLLRRRTRSRGLGSTGADRLCVCPRGRLGVGSSGGWCGGGHVISVAADLRAKRSRLRTWNSLKCSMMTWERIHTCARYVLRPHARETNIRGRVTSCLCMLARY